MYEDYLTILKNLRENGWTLQEIANKCGSTRFAVSLWLAERRKPNGENYYQIINMKKYTKNRK